MRRVTYRQGVYGALAHPARRRLIELLRAGPRTTGELAGAFAVSRFAVMKHLAVLERCGVVAVRREGRRRFNELTPGPLSEIETIAQPGRRVEDAGPGGPSGSTSAGSAGAPDHLPVFRIERLTVLDASPGQVFDALTFNIGSWWGPPYLRSPEATRVVLEAQPGGRFFEEWGHRQGFVRGIVTGVRQDERLEVRGTIAGTSPLPSVLEIVLARRDSRTRLSLTHCGIGGAVAGSGDPVAGYGTAWDDLVDGRLRSFVERGIRSGIGADASSPPGAWPTF